MPSEETPQASPLCIVMFWIMNDITGYWQWGRFNMWHMDCFRKLTSLPGFSGSIIPGSSTELARGEDNAMNVDNATDDHCRGQVNGNAEGNEDNNEDDQEDEDIQAIVSVLMSLTIDAPGVV